MAFVLLCPHKRKAIFVVRHSPFFSKKIISRANESKTQATFALAQCKTLLSIGA